MKQIADAEQCKIANNNRPKKSIKKNAGFLLFRASNFCSARWWWQLNKLNGQ
jgi:hypothetical protein